LSLHSLAALYLAMTLTVGLILIVLVPPFQVPDEPQHFERAYELSQGQVWSTVNAGRAGAYLPSSVVDFIDCFPTRQGDGGPRKAVLGGGCKQAVLESRGGGRNFVSFEGAAFYSPIAYIPQVLGIAIGKVLGLGIYKQFLAARLMNLLASASIIGIALCLAPTVAPLVMVVALLPMSLFELASASPDALTIGSSLCYFAGAIRACKRGRWGSEVGALACLCAICFLSLKPVYAPILLLPLSQTLLSKEKWRPVGLVSMVIAAVAIASTILWLRSASSAFKLHIPGVDPTRQLAFLLSHGPVIPSLIFSTLLQKGAVYIDSMFGVLGWWNIILPSQIYACCAISCFSAAVFVSFRSASATMWINSFSALMISLAVILLILLAMYLVWSKVGAITISGVQGRYFLPIAPIFLLAISNAMPPTSAFFRRTVRYVFFTTLVAPAIALPPLLALVYGLSGLNLLATG
jgi:uncharacterized membrane protein